ncbi:MAG: hypothetical protein QXU64_02075 [Thermofilaceae archaeon]
MAERRRERPPLPDPFELLIDGPLRLIRELGLGIERAVETLNRGLWELDEVLSRPLDVPAPRYRTAGSAESAGIAMSPSYPGQTPTDYCLECLERHFLKAHALLEEAERFSLKHGRITPEAREKIRRAMEEIVGAEDDLRVVPEDREIAGLLDEIKIMQRDLRKWAWARGLTTVSESIEDLRELKRRVEELVKKTYEAAEIYRRKYGTCPACESLAEEVSERFGVSKSEILEALRGLASDDRERAMESARRLKELGVFDYIVRRIEEMLREMKGGGGGQAEREHTGEAHK